jgi:DNA repair exonuclease SbcCD ATPase subunit
MILPKALALSVQIIMLVATVDRVPQLDVEPVCKGIAEQGGVTFRDPAVAQEKKNCIESEQAVREQVIKQWSSFSADDRTHCVNETTMGGLSSYTELLTCLEMARDVRAMRAAEAAAPSRAAATRAPSSPSTATVQPAPPAEPVSRPTSANEPQKLEVDSTLKELERAKAEAQNARSSEALAQRKLADAEAALQRTKEEAERTTNEAQGRKRTHKLRGSQKPRQSVSSPMRKRLERLPKGENKPAKALPKANQVLAPGYESGSGGNPKNP